LASRLRLVDEVKHRRNWHRANQVEQEIAFQILLSDAFQTCDHQALRVFCHCEKGQENVNNENRVANHVHGNPSLRVVFINECKSEGHHRCGLNYREKDKHIPQELPWVLGIDQVPLHTAFEFHVFDHIEKVVNFCLR
jgi:hypothetical protein